jgi:hypothetical protein
MLDDRIKNKGSSISRYAKARKVEFLAVSRIGNSFIFFFFYFFFFIFFKAETGTSSYCWQPFHLKALQKASRMAVPVTAEKAKEKHVYYHHRVQTASCHRLKICSQWECSKTVVHRDGSAAAHISVKQWIRMTLGDPNRRKLAEYLLTAEERREAVVTATPHFMDRGKEATKKLTGPKSTKKRATRPDGTTEKDVPEVEKRTKTEPRRSSRLEEEKKKKEEKQDVPARESPQLL